MPDITLPLAMLKKPIEMVGGLATGATKEIVQKLKAERSLKNIYQRLNSTQKVKTIWNVERSISISSFYYPASIETSERVTQKITCLDDLPTNATVLKGTAGQGKSILLRWLLGKEIRSGKRIPLFIELRRVQGSSLITYAITSFSELLDIKTSEDIFTEFAKAGKISILLDGYDEIDPEFSQKITSEIEDLAAKFPESRIVVTSRPQSGIENSYHFDVIPIAKLSKDDFEPFFEKILSKDKILAKRLCAAIKNSKFSIGALVSTPLLATLLTIVYRAHQKIPADFAEFYDELFQILLVRHDRSKPGYERKRKTNLSDREMQQVFEAFCFKTKAHRLGSVTRQRALEISAECIKSVGCTCNENHFMADIKSVTCLLNEEGGQFDFLHQSVQEFFAARYVLTRPDTVATKFYSAAVNGKWANWQQELLFLSRIDPYRSSRDFFIPSLQKILEDTRFDQPDFTETSDNIISKQIGVRQKITQGPEDSTKRYFIYDNFSNKYYGSECFSEKMYAAMFKRADAIPWQRNCFDGITDGQKISYFEIATSCGVISDLQQSILEAANEIAATIINHQQTILEQDSTADFMNI